MNTEEKNDRPEFLDTSSMDIGISVGSILDGRYEILEQFGEGGVGLVYRARHVKLGLPVAIKVLQDQFVSHKMMRPRFEREARTLATLAHPHIVSVNDFGIVDGRPYLVMELLEGQTLRELLNKGPLPIDRVMQITRQLLNALAYAHSQGFVHRDLKPSNVFIQQLPDGSFHIKILDFGLVKFVDQETHDGSRSLTRSGMAVGTPSYMAPEQVIGDKIGTSTDVYAIGILMFEMLTGRAPFTGELADVVRRQLTEKIPSLGQAAANLQVTAELNALLQRAVEKDPTKRYPDAARLLKAFESLPNPAAVRKDVSLDATIAASWLPGATTEDTRPIGARRPISRVLPWVRMAARVLWQTLVWIAKVTAWFLRGLAWTTVQLFKGLAITIRALYRVARRAGPRKVAWAGLFVLVIGVVGFLWVDESPEPLVKPKQALAAKKAPSLTAVRDVIEEKLKSLVPSSEEIEGLILEPEGAAASLSNNDDKSDKNETVDKSGVVDSTHSEASPGERGDDKRPAATNPWARRRVPRILSSYRKRIFRKEKLNERALKSLRDFQRKNRSDPRPSLLLARAYMVRGWYRDAIERYQLAYKIDPSSRGDRHMVSDLVEIVRYPKVSNIAARAIMEIYGEEALNIIDRDLAASSVDEDAKDALRRLRERIVADAK
jgi:tetratricopeptide (TPR) repeat protein